MMMTKCKVPSTFLSYVFSLACCFHSVEITPPPTPSPVKAAGGKKRAIAIELSDEEDDSDVFIPRYDMPLLCDIQNIVC